MFEEGKYYAGDVIAAGLDETKTTKYGLLWFKIKTAEGTISWESPVTEGTLGWIPKTLGDCFGITEEQIATKDWLTNEMPKEVVGEEVRIVPHLKVFKPGEPGRWVVKYMNPSGFRHKPASPEVSDAVAALMRQKIAAKNQPARAPGEDLPF